jgi:ribosomal protein S18 acetylase RimI-like enzyme
MSRAGLRIEPLALASSLSPEDEGRAAFESIRERLYPTALPEPVSPHARCLIAWYGGEPAARLSVEMAADVRGVEGPVGVVGHYEAVDAEAGIALLRHCRALLTRAGAVGGIGPMNGSPWMRYRLALPSEPEELSAEPPFFTEPWNPAEYGRHFLEAGYVVVSRYESRIVPCLPVVRPQAEALAERVAAAGIRIRPLDTGRWEEELQDLFEFSAVQFAAGPYHRPADLSLFRETCLQLRPILDPELVRIAHDSEERLVGFALALPDRLSAATGRPPRLVLKTLATSPCARQLGVGACLSDEVHRLAHRKGYRAVIHALMHEENESVRLSLRYGSRLYRRYALFGWGTAVGGARHPVGVRR